MDSLQPLSVDLKPAAPVSICQSYSPQFSGSLTHEWHLISFSGHIHRRASSHFNSGIATISRSPCSLTLQWLSASNCSWHHLVCLPRRAAVKFCRAMSLRIQVIALWAIRRKECRFYFGVIQILFLWGRFHPQRIGSNESFHVHQRDIAWSPFPYVFMWCHHKPFE